jgi:hypothetical protein
MMLEKGDRQWRGRTERKERETRMGKGLFGCGGGRAYGNHVFSEAPWESIMGGGIRDRKCVQVINVYSIYTIGV